MPITLTRKTVIGTFVASDGVTPAKGGVAVKLTAPLIDSAGNVIVEPAEHYEPMDATGSVQFSLVATNDPGVQPEGVAYRFVVRRDGENDARTFDIELDAAGPETVYLAGITPATTTPRFTYALESALTEGLAAAATDATTKANAAQAAALVAVDDISLRNQATLGQASESGGVVTVSYVSNWGIDSAGDPYYDSAGAVDGEEAALIVGADGSFNLITFGG